MKILVQGSLFALAVSAIALVSTPQGSARQVGARRIPVAVPSAGPAQRAPRVGVAVPALPPEAFPSPGTLLVNQSFAYSKTPPNAFGWIDQACLTAGKTVVSGSVPPCGDLAPQDKNGSGALENTNASTFAEGWVAYEKPLSTALGLQVAFTIYSFDGDSADGQLLYFTDASGGPPTTIGRFGGNLGYTSGYGLGGLDYAYLGIGFDESGQFSQDAPYQGLNGGSPNRVPETITARGAASTSYYYLGGALNAQGQPASLPFNWDQPSKSRPATGRTVFVTLSPTGYVTCAIDIHDGNGFVTYYSQSIVGVNGQPAVPANVYIGVTGSNGGGVDRHQIEDFFIWQG